jgi:hypothetical protein
MVGKNDSFGVVTVDRDVVVREVDGVVEVVDVVSVVVRVVVKGSAILGMFFFFKYFLGDFFSFFSYNIQHCFICRPSDSTVPTDAGIEPRTVATGALAVRRSNH